MMCRRDSLLHKGSRPKCNKGRKLNLSAAATRKKKVQAVKIIVDTNILMILIVNTWKKHILNSWTIHVTLQPFVNSGFLGFSKYNLSQIVLWKMHKDLLHLFNSNKKMSTKLLAQWKLQLTVKFYLVIHCLLFYCHFLVFFSCWYIKIWKWPLLFQSRYQNKLHVVVFTS